MTRKGVSSRRQVTRPDEELGELRLCRQCREWWPDDEDFWYTIPAGGGRVIRGRLYVRKTATKVCKACHNAAVGRYELKRRLRTERSHIGCATPGCLVLVPIDRGGRCHGCEGRILGPLTVELLEELTGRRQAA